MPGCHRNAPKELKHYGTSPQFDFNEFKDSFKFWQRQWSIILALSTIDTVLPQADHTAYKAIILL